MHTFGRALRRQSTKAGRCLQRGQQTGQRVFWVATSAMAPAIANPPAPVSSRPSLKQTQSQAGPVSSRQGEVLWRQRPIASFRISSTTRLVKRVHQIGGGGVGQSALRSGNSSSVMRASISRSFSHRHPARSRRSARKSPK